MACPRCGRPTNDEETFCGQCGLASDMEADPAALAMVGKVLDERYRLQYLIGIGGMGAVYRGEVVGPGHTIAVKVLHPTVSADPVARRRLENEAQLASRIDHPNIVSILDYRSSFALTYLVMEYLSGQSLADVLGAIGYLGVRRTVHITRQLLSALEAAHSHDVLHRDLKPENIYLTAGPDGLDTVKVLDFGMAMSQGAGPKITNDGRICGTPAYMSPEQARGRELDFRSDLYAVGVVLYECLTAVNPFLGETATDTLLNQVTAEIVPPSRVRKEAKIPPFLDALVMRALHKDPDKRFQSAAEFRQVLEGMVLAGSSTPSQSSIGAIRTCPQCGKPIPKAGSRCDACGLQLSTPIVDEKLEDLLSPELISALNQSWDDSEEIVHLDATSTITACPIIAWDPPLAGLQRQLEALDRFFDTRSSVFLRLLGSPGAGKGRLAKEAQRRARARDWLTIWAELEHQPAISPLEPIRSAAARLMRLPKWPCDEETLLESAAREGIDLGDNRLGLLELFGLTMSPDDPADERRARRANAWRAVVRAATNRGPLLLVFRDLDEMDSPSRELIAALAGSVNEPRNPLIVVVTHDPGMMLLWPETETWTMPTLAEQEAISLATTIVNTAGIDVAPKQLAASSRGVPLMLIELARLAAVDPMARLPSSLGEAINRRFSWLPARPRTLLHALAVLGRPSPPEQLATLTDEPSDPGAFTLLSRHGFISPSATGWRPSHRVHREVAYASTPVAVRGTLHRKAAEIAIEDKAPPSLIAHHLFAVGDFRQALPHLLSAGWRALEALDDDLATQLFNRVLQFVPAPPQTYEGDTEPWASASMGLATAMKDGGDAASALGLIDSAARAARAAHWMEVSEQLERYRWKLDR